jgi:peptide/nickel transport system permease protein
MSFWRRLLGRPAAALGFGLVALALAGALLAGLLARNGPVEQFRDSTGQAPGYNSPEDGTFLLGTDINGRDVFARVLAGSRISLIVGCVATLLNLIIGVLIGLPAGFYGRWLDSLLMRVTDTFFAFPGTLLAIIVLATLNQPEARAGLARLSGGMDPGLLGLFIALGLSGWTGIARVVRGQVLALKEREFVEAARAIGCSNARIMFVHLLPNCLAPLIVLATLQVAYNILSEAGLSFLGLGIQPPAASWGGMLSEARPYLAEMPWWGIFPGISLALTVLGFNLLGDGLRDVLDPRLRLR